MKGDFPMTFRLPTSDDSIATIFNSLYNLKMKIYQSHLTDIIGLISILLVVAITFALMALIFKNSENNKNQSRIKPWLKKKIFGEALKTWINVSIGAGTLLVLGFIIEISIYLGSNPYSFVNSSIIPGTAIIDKNFGSQSNTEDLDLDGNKLLLSDAGDTLLLATASRTHHTLTLKPASKTGKAYLRVLEYARQHKKRMFKPNLTVALDKTTLTYQDIDGNHTIVCYANNTNKTTNNKTVLHY